MATHSHLTSGKKIAQALSLLLLLALLAACSDNSAGQNSQPTTPANTNQLVKLDLGIPEDAKKSPTAGELPPDTSMHIDITFQANQELLKKLGDQKGGTSTDLGTMADQIGINQQQYQQAKSFFGIQGATLKLNRLHTNLAITAKASTFSKLLHTRFLYHQYQDRKFFAPNSDLMLPKGIADRVIGINGLDNYSAPPKPGTTNPEL